MYEIIDNNGVIHSGSEEEMCKAFDIMTNPVDYDILEVDEWGCDWIGDLKFVHIIEIAK